MAVKVLDIEVNLSEKGFNEPLCFSAPMEGVTAIFGPSGSGKTSLLRAVSGLDRHPESKIMFENQVWQDQRNFVPTHQRGLAYVFQDASLFSHLTVEQNIQFALDRSSKKGAPNRISKAAVCEALNISELLARSPRTLSGGEAQRVALARALCSNPRLLLMDEPLSALDLGHKSEIIPLLEKVCNQFNVPALYVSHSLEEVARLADYLVLIDAGKLVSHGPTQEILVTLDLPYAHQPDAMSVVTGKVLGQDKEYAITVVETEIGEVSLLQGTHLEVGQQVKIRIAARDVSITTERSSDTSILNRLPATVVELAALDEAQMVVKLEVNGSAFLSKVTRKSMHALDIKVGKNVVAQVKSCALL